MERELFNPEQEIQEVQHPVSVENMDAQVKRALSGMENPVEEQQTFDQIKQALEQSSNFDDFAEKYHKLFDSRVLSAGHQANKRERAMLDLDSALLPIFSNYFAAKDGYKDLDLWLKDHTGASYRAEQAG